MMTAQQLEVIMASGTSETGGDFLTRKSDATKVRQGLPHVSDVLIVEDKAFDADRLKATLHVMLGYDLTIRHAATLGSGLDAVIARKPSIVFLDDYLEPNDNASETIPYLRRAGYEGPIVVVSGELDRQRRVILMTAGASDVIHKDDLDSVRVAEALARSFKLLAKTNGA
jgi:DNA-binding NarL/FixJ family response regulator